MRYDDTDYQFNATTAKREAVPALIGLWGASGSGKTFSGLKLARGLVGKDGVICVLDTENGRAKFYSDVSGPWIHLDIQPPFSPDKYSAAFKYLRKEHSADVIIVDSMSHVWEGEGGVLDMAENAKSANGYALKGLAKWKDPKLAHKRMSNDITRSPVHVVFCLRQKDLMKTVVDDKGKEAYVFDRHVPIAEKNFVFEMTVALRLKKDGYYDDDTHELYYKVPEGLKSAFPRGGQVNEAMGQALGAWLAGGVAIDKETANLVADGREASFKGVAFYKTFYDGLSSIQNKKIQPFHVDFKATAEAVDSEKNAQALVDKTNALFKTKASCTTCAGRGLIEKDGGKEPCPDCQKSE